MGKSFGVLAILLASTAGAVEFPTDDRPFDRFERPSEPTFRPTWVRKVPGHYSKTDWRRAIDSVWGPGLPTHEKLEIMDAWWDTVSAEFACFNNLPLTWDSLNALVSYYRAEVEDTVSRGRFAGIMSHLALQLAEAHTYARDLDVCDYTELLPGVPVQVIGGWAWDQHFGAGLTLLEDSTLVVYSVKNSIPHPLELRPGDIILGYDRMPWAELCRELREAELPVAKRWWWGSSPRSLHHTLMISAGLNWHLFDTIDIVRYAGDDTVHLPTSLMVGYEPYMIHSEQIDIESVPKPNLDLSQSVSYGVMDHDEHRIGYIYSWTWKLASSAEFRQACSTLVSLDSIEGIIIDYRFNSGGSFASSDAGYYWLFRDAQDVVDICRRSNPTDPYGLNMVGRKTVSGNGVGYGKPVAVLLGPGCVSAGDYAAYAATLLDVGPVRTFGRPPNTAHIGGQRAININWNWAFNLATYETRECDDPTSYLTHLGFAPDTFVWHTKEAIATGRDAVVEAAATWVLDPDAVTEMHAAPGYARRSGPTLVRGILPLSGESPAALLDITGRQVMELEPGRNDIRHVPPGVYFVRQKEANRTTKVVVQK